MKKIIFHFLFLLTLLTNQVTKLQAQITRGAEPDEIYISIDWYVDNQGKVHDAIFRSSNNGKNLSLQYEALENPLPGEMRIGHVLGDATPGALYNYGWCELWASFDYGESWEYREDYSYAIYATGFFNGEIFRRSNYNLYRSENYGETFELIVESLTEPLSDVGNQAGELYGFTGNPGVGYNLFHSMNYGQTYTEIHIDSTVAFWSPGGHYPQISRGTEPGELYLVSWWPDYHYKIFHSTDTGYHWTEKYESGYINIFYWGASFTAGRVPGSFYVIRSTQSTNQSHLWLYIDYSSDYGESFTTYFHDLDSLYTTISSLPKPEFCITVSPNPFSSFTNISFELPVSHQSSEINILNMHGQLIRKIRIPEVATQLQWDGTDEKGMPVPQGIYLLNICNGTYSSNYHKLLFTN